MYTIGDFLIQLKNAYGAYRKTLEYRYSNTVFSIAKILEKEGFVAKVSVDKEANKLIKIDLRYDKNIPAISEIKLISKPSVHHYVGKTRIRKVIARHAVGIISTNKGVMTSREAERQGVGGELICQVY